MSQELQDYIAQARKVGKSDEEIVKELLNVGWKIEDIVKELDVPQPNKSQSFKSDAPKKTRTNVMKALLVFFIIALAYIIYPKSAEKAIPWPQNDNIVRIPESYNTTTCKCFGVATNRFNVRDDKTTFCLIGFTYACENENTQSEVGAQDQAHPVESLNATDPTLTPEELNEPSSLPDYAQSDYTAPTQERLTDQQFYDLVDEYRTQLGGNWGTGNYSGSVEDAGNNVYSVSVGSPEPVPFFVGFYKGQWVVAHQGGIYWCELLRRTNYSDQVKMRLGVMQCSTQ